MIEAAALVVLTALLVGAVLFHARESAAWRVERAELLNRIMARSYTDFVYAQPSANEPERPQMTSDAAEAAYAKEIETIDRAWHEQNAKAHPDMYPDGIEALVA